MSKHTTATLPGPEWRVLLASSWRQNIIYLGFVVIFIIFSVALYDKGFLEIGRASCRERVLTDV